MLLSGLNNMLGKLHRQDILSNFESVQNQVILERDLQQFFKVTPPVKIEGEFRDIGGSASNQFLYLNLVLKVIEELDIEPVQAFALLEAIRPVIYRKFEAITDRFIGKAVLPGAKTTAIVFEAIEVFARLTDTYDSVIEEAKHFGDSQTFIMGSAIHRALSDKARLVRCYMQLYHDVPQSVWRHINNLYRTADEFNIFNQVMPDKLAFPDHPLTVRQLYLYIMLLSCAGTRNISMEEISALAELLKDWVKQVTIRKPDLDSEQVVLCMDPLRLETPAFSCQIEDKNSSGLFVIDLGKLPEKLQRTHVHHKFIGNVRYTLSPWTTDKVISNWTRFVERGYLRHTEVAQRKINAHVGLRMTWLVNSPVPSAVNDPGTSYRALRDKKLDFNLSSDAGQLDPITALPSDKFLSLQPLVIDHSNTGYCLQWTESAAVKPAIDEILIIQDDQDGIFRLGQVVWIKAISRTQYQTGVSIISSEVTPVFARIIPLAYSRHNEKYSRGFVTCHLMGNRKHFGILLEQAGWRTGDALELVQNEKTVQARILEPLSQSEKYQSFNIAFFKD